MGENEQRVVGENERRIVGLMMLNNTLRQDVLRHGQDLLTRYDMTVSQMRILDILGTAGTVSAQQLATALGVTPSTVTTSVDRLVRRGLVSRQEDPADRRRKRLSLTEEGQRVNEATLSQGLGLMDNVLKELTEKELGDLERLLKRMIEIRNALQST